MPVGDTTPIQGDALSRLRTLHEGLGNPGRGMHPRLGSALDRQKGRGPYPGPRQDVQERAGGYSGLGGRLDARVVLEELLVDLRVLLPLSRQLVVDEDRLDGADGFAGSAVDTLVRVDVEHGLALVDAVHRADLDTGLVLDIDAGLRNHVRHSGLPVDPLLGEGSEV